MSESQSVKVARSAGVVSAAIASSRVTGLVREMVMAQAFGAGFIYDAFLLGFRIPNLTRNLFAEGALSSAFVPVFSAYLQQRDEKEAARLSNLVGTAIIVIVGLFCLLGMIFSPQLVWLMAPGYAQVPGKFALAVKMTRIMFPFLLLVALAAQAMGVLNSCNRFGVPAMASTFFNIGSIVVGLFLGFYLGPRLHITPIEGMAYGVVIGGAIQLAWQVPSLRRFGFHFRFAFDWRHPGLAKIFNLMIPAIIGNAAVQVNVMVNTNFASRLLDPVRGADGPVSWLGYAFRFMQLPLGLFGVSFASAILPSLSRSAAADNLEEFRKTLAHSVGAVLVMTIPSAVGLILLGRPIIGAIFQGGHFDVYDTEQTALALSFYAIGLAGYATLKLVNPAFYALSDARTPMWISMLSIAINFAAAEYLISSEHMGIAGLALATSLVALTGCFVSFAAIRKHLRHIEGRYLLSRVLRVSAASLVMAAPVWIINQYIGRHFGFSRAADLFSLALCLPIGVVSFGVAARWLRLEEIEMALASLRASAKKRLLPARYNPQR
ncbi:MAG TPA: murein biosynthesis integral membrane protein MurJ [Bryobacteraceae bacterium]|nr:murein biosynthesis integral membrane protein MurJ [Bryobacteraceae bacterium]